jgi:molybdopterin synthase sulfur carrier subunit
VIRVVLPPHLRTLARVDGEVALELEGPATLGSVLDALEARYPVLRGTIRDHVTHRRRAFLRFFACEEDLSHEPPETPLPPAVAAGKEPFLVVGAMAGGSGASGVAPPRGRRRRAGLRRVLGAVVAIGTGLAAGSAWAAWTSAMRQASGEVPPPQAE